MAMIIRANAELLFEVRQAVDGPLNGENLYKLRRQVHRYSAALDRARAFVFMADTLSLGYILVETYGAPLPVGAPAAVTGEVKGFAHIEKIGVIADERRRRIGTALIAEAERWLRVAGVRGLWLDYRPDLPGLTKFYSRTGFTDLVEFEDKNKKTRRIASKTI